jgi:hypothetical protein
MSDEHLKTLLLVRSILFTISLNNLYVRINLYVIIFLYSSFEMCTKIYCPLDNSRIIIHGYKILAHNELLIMINFIEIEIDSGGYPKRSPREQV